MQQNQKYDKNSLVDNKELRYKVSLDLCKYLNEVIKKKDANYKEEDLFTEEDVRNIVNNEKVFEKYKLANSQDTLLNKLKNKSSQYKIDENYKTEENAMQNRDMYLLMDLNDSIEADEHNQNICNYSFEKDAQKVIPYKLIDKYSEVDPKSLYPTNEEEVLNQSEEDIYNNQIGWSLNVSKVLAYDKDLAKRLEATNIFRQVRAKEELFETYKTVFSLLLPSKKAMKLAYLSNYQDNFNDYIMAKFPNITEFKMKKASAKKSDFIKGKSAGDIFGFTKYTQKLAMLEVYYEQYKINKEMVEAGIITKGLGTDYYFVNEKGELANTIDVKKNYLNGKLINGYQKVYWTEEEKQRTETMKQGAYSLAKLIDYINLGNKLRTESQVYELELSNKLSYFNRIINPFKKEIDELADGLEKFQKVNAFMEQHKELISEIDDLKRDVLEQKGKLKDREVCKNYIDDVSKGNSALNYDKLEKLANSKTEGIHYDDIQDVLNGYPENKMLVELFNSKFTKNIEDIKNQLGSVKPYIKKKDILTNIALIKDMNDKHREYQNRGTIGKWWYANSHERMLATRNKLITDLTSKGVSEATISQLNKQDNPDLGKLSQEIVESVKQYQIGQIKNIETLYKIYLEAPKKAIDDLNKQKEDLDNLKEYLKDKAIEIKEEMFTKFKETQPELFSNNKDMKASDVETLGDNDMIVKINDAFKKYRDDLANKKDKDALETAYNAYKEKSEKLNDLSDEIKEREKYLKNGKPFNDLEFDKAQRDKKANAGKTLQERLEETDKQVNNNLNVNVEGVKKTAVIKNTGLDNQKKN